MISFFSGLFLCLIAENHTLTTLLHNESSYLYTTCLKNWEFDKKASQNSDLKRATIVRAQGASEDENFEKKPTQSKTNSLGYFGIRASFLKPIQSMFIFFLND